MKTGTGGHIEYTLAAAFQKVIDKKAAFAFGTRVPVDERVPLVNKAFNIFAFIVICFANSDRIVAVFLYFSFHDSLIASPSVIQCL